MHQREVYPQEQCRQALHQQERELHDELPFLPEMLLPEMLLQEVCPQEPCPQALRQEKLDSQEEPVQNERLLPQGLAAEIEHVLGKHAFLHVWMA